MSNPYAEHFRKFKIEPSSRTAEEWARVAPRERLGRMFSARVMDERLLAELKAMVDDALSEGMSQQDFVMYARRRLAAIRSAAGIPYNGSSERAEWGEEERERYENDVRHVDSVARLKLILRTQSRMANGVREFEQAFEDFWLEQFPGWRFVRQPGAKEEYKREDHVAHENEVRLKTDTDFWLARNDPSFGGFNNPYPPFGYNSWCWVEPVSRQECERLGLLPAGERLTVPKRLADWGLGAAVQQLATAGVQDMPEEAVRRVEERCEADGIPLEKVMEDGMLHELRVDLSAAAGTRDRSHVSPDPDTELPSWEEDLDIGDGLFDDWDDVAAARGMLPPAAGMLWRALAMRRRPRRERYGTVQEYRDAVMDWRRQWGT